MPWLHAGSDVGFAQNPGGAFRVARAWAGSSSGPERLRISSVHYERRQCHQLDTHPAKDDRKRPHGREISRPKPVP